MPTINNEFDEALRALRAAEELRAQGYPIGEPQLNLKFETLEALKLAASEVDFPVPVERRPGEFSSRRGQVHLIYCPPKTGARS